MKRSVSFFPLQILALASLIEAACVIPQQTLPLDSYRFRPSTLQIFTALNLTCSGFVTGWRVALIPSKSHSKINGVYLAVFRQVTTSKFQLVGITEINRVVGKPSDGNFTWQVIPARPQFPVQRGDVLGIFYKRWFLPEREVSIPIADHEAVPTATAPTFVAMKDWYNINDALRKGGVISMSDSAIVKRLPALQVYLNVGICGNKKIEDAEECDDGNRIDNDGCSSFCRRELKDKSVAMVLSICGNGLLETPAEECDDSNRVNGDGCSSNCLLEDPEGPACGNGRLEPGEQCDDGNFDNNDGCSTICRVEKKAQCGNGALEKGEQCDDGNIDDEDGCSSKCRLENIVGIPSSGVASPEISSCCGDKVITPDEQCDDGNTMSGDGCSSTCTKEICGNGVIEAGEECDDGNLHSDDGCSSNCILERCGNGVLERSEQCDDGNARDGDGCSNRCKLEICGNSKIDFGEQCDDGNIDDGDGCSKFCTIEIKTTKLTKPPVTIDVTRRAKVFRAVTQQQLPTTVAPKVRKQVTKNYYSEISPIVESEFDYSKYAEGETFQLGGAAIRQVFNDEKPSGYIKIGRSLSKVSPTKDFAPECLEAPLLGGVCRHEAKMRWFYNSLTRTCDWFYDKSCYFGSNYFTSKNDCMVACGSLVVPDANPFHKSYRY